MCVYVCMYVCMCEYVCMCVYIAAMLIFYEFYRFTESTSHPPKRIYVLLEGSVYFLPSRITTLLFHSTQSPIHPALSPHLSPEIRRLFTVQINPRKQKRTINKAYPLVGEFHMATNGLS